MISFNAVFSTLFLMVSIHTCQGVTVTLGSLQQNGPCDPSVFKLGSLTISPGSNGSIEGTFEVLTELDANYRVALNFSQLVPEGQQQPKKVVVSARSGMLCSAIGDFPWLLHDIKIEPHVSECPIPVGKYTVEGFRFDSDRFKFYVKGSYEIDMQLFHEDRLICGANVGMQLA